MNNRRALKYFAIFFLGIAIEGNVSAGETFLQSGIFSIDVSTDPRSIAMGESGVALYANSYGMFSNPATLAGLTKTSVAYTRRTMNWITDGLQYTSLTAAVTTPFCTIGILYNRFSQGDFQVSTPSNPEGDGTRASLYDHTLGVGLGKEISNYLSVGLSIKTFNIIQSYSGPSAAMLDQMQDKTLPILFDFGFLYRNVLNKSNETFHHQFTAGFNLQNIGSSLKISQRPSNISSQSQEIVYQPPQYLRLGMCYQAIQGGATAEALNILGFSATLEYRNAINSNGYPGRNYWGVGCEVLLYEIASVRIGGYSAPYKSIYGEEGKIAIRYGFGLNAPLQKLNDDIPFTVSFDYAAIPLINIQFVSTKETTLHVYSIKLQYENELF